MRKDNKRIIKLIVFFFFFSFIFFLASISVNALCDSCSPAGGADYWCGKCSTPGCTAIPSSACCSGCLHCDGCCESCGCASSTCIGSTCDDGCGGSCAGTMNCCTADGGACSAGTDCCNGYCVNGLCRSACSSTYNGNQCSNTASAYTAYGICTRQTGTGWSCDATISAYNTTYYLYQCSDTGAIYGTGCDSNSLAGGYSANGICAGSSHGTCYAEYASDSTASITSSSTFGTQTGVCTAGHNAYYCDYIGDGIFGPAGKRCDESDSLCRSCSTNVDNETLCESGCAAPAVCDELAVGAYPNTCNGAGQTYLRDICGSSSTCTLVDQSICGYAGAGCTGSRACEGLAPSTDITNCTAAGQTYYADTCGIACAAQERSGTICKSSAFAAGCTANASANDKSSSTCDGTSGYINSSCAYYNDGDYNSTVCMCIKGAGFWNLGGEVSAGTCCSDDASGEYVLTRLSDESVMENSFADNSSDNACCLATTDCVSNSQCANTLTSPYDVDGDGDNDYCLNTVWKDCNTNLDCNGNQLCFVTTNDCISVDGYIQIRNLGITGIEQTNQEYTSTRQVMLVLNYTDKAVSCRYANNDASSEPPIFSSSSWSYWESCITNRVWELAAGGGMKRVFYQINNSYGGNSYIINKSDTIYYNYTGVGLDTTPPTSAAIVDGDYTNNVDSVEISWYNATDAESVILGIPLRYQYRLYLLNGTTLDTQTTTSTSIVSDISDHHLTHNKTMYVNVTVINSAGLKASSISDGLTIDLNAPDIWSLQGNLINISSGVSVAITGPIEDIWVYATRANFSWQGYDDMSLFDIPSYSYILTKSAGTGVDDIPEGTLGNLQNEIAKIYTTIPSGKYYFKVKAKDKAGNWGAAESLIFSIDSTPASKPRVLTDIKSASTVTYTWSESTDPESGVAMYMINLTASDGTVLKNKTTLASVRSATFSLPSTGDYNATIYAMNKAGIWRGSNQEGVSNDFTPPSIYATPKTTVITNYPVLKVWTDEQAVCYYNNTPFLYTNTTYHENKLEFLQNGYYAFTIDCTDMSENMNTASVNFTINTALLPDTGIILNTPLAYETLLVTYKLRVNDNSIPLAGISSANFKVRIDGKEVESSVFDMGDGTYNASFYTPESGSFDINITYASGLSQAATLSVNRLIFSTIYADALIVTNATNTRHITSYSFADDKIGLATDSEVDISGLRVSTQRLNLSYLAIDSNLYIFNTKNSANLQDKERRLKEKIFIGAISPSFGYPAEEKYLVNFILRYEDFSLRSGIGDTISQGNQNLNIIRQTVNRETVIQFNKYEGQNKNIILTIN